MRRVVSKWIPTLVAVVAGVLTLAGYLFPRTPLGSYRDRLIEWAVIVGAFAFVLGLVNVLGVHVKRASHLERGWPYSVALLLAALLSWIPPLMHGGQGRATQEIFKYVISPLGTSLTALLVFTLTLAAFRLLGERRSPWSLLFVVVVGLTLLGSAPIRGLGWLGDVREWLISIPAMAGMRGLLLGVALGTVITGLRVLLTQDHPYSPS